jgi:hypothetical protein
MKNNTLDLVNPDLAKQWHPTKNNGLTPDMVTHGSNKKVWWKCPHGHEWEARISNRSKGSGCPYCKVKQALKGSKKLAVINPELAEQWHPTKNKDLTPDKVTAGSNRKIWWLGDCGHEWEATICNRHINGSGCPYCAGQKVLKGFNDLASQNPGLASQWNYKKNKGLTPEMVTVNSSKKVWWIDSHGRERFISVNNRNNKG